MIKMPKQLLLLSLILCGFLQPVYAENAVCIFDDVEFKTDFPTARLNGCREKDGEYFLTIKPEKKPINPSPWYAFRVISEDTGRIAITLNYEVGKHRYWPKFSINGRDWYRVNENDLEIAEDGRSARITVKVKAEEPLWIAGQEIFTSRQHTLWMLNAARTHDFLDIYDLGKSSGNREIYKLESRAASPEARTILLLGRQHPPEVTGALAMVPFMEALFADTELARHFRARYRIVAIPNLNPDGVALGNWRGNKNGQDLNRDWGRFTQPETELVRREMTRFGEGRDGALALMLDFHSTWENLLYTQPEAEPTQPENFAAAWHQAVMARAGDIPFRLAPEDSDLEKGTSKGYFYAAYGIPAITYEMADDADRDNIHRLATIAAEEMMKIMLAD